MKLLIGDREGLHLAVFVASDNNTYFKFKVHKSFEHARGIWDKCFIGFLSTYDDTKAIVSSCCSLPNEGQWPALLGSFKTGSSSHHLKARGWDIVIGVKLFLLSLILNEFQAIRIWVYFFSLCTKIA